MSRIPAVLLDLYETCDLIGLLYTYLHMTTIPTVSIILPVYNAKSTLSKCVESVLAQSYSDFELLLVNDGSTDDSAVLCDQFSALDPRVRTLHKKNGGCGSARNIAFDEARGRWIAFCDADDWVGDRWLECFMENINDADLVVQGFHCHNWPFGGNTEIGLDDYIGPKTPFVEELYELAAAGYLWCKLFRSDIIHNLKLRFDESVQHRSDEEFLMRYLLAVDVVSNVKQGHYHYDCPDNKVKYLDRLSADCFFSLFTSIKEMFPTSYCSKLMAQDYFDDSTMLLLRKYKARDTSREHILKQYIAVYSDEIHRVKYRRILFKPLYFILQKNNLSLSHSLLSIYSSALGKLGKI